MKVALRKKALTGGRSSLYLDFYPALLHPDTGKLTRREFLGIQLFNKPKDELERRHNKETMKLAEHTSATPNRIPEQSIWLFIRGTAKRELY
jgi:hypothetical protein